MGVLTVLQDVSKQASLDTLCQDGIYETRDKYIAIYHGYGDAVDNACGRIFSTNFLMAPNPKLILHRTGEAIAAERIFPKMEMLMDELIPYSPAINVKSKLVPLPSRTFSVLSPPLSD